MKRGYPARPIIDRFNEKVFYSPDGCWYWIGQISKNKKWPSHIRPYIKIGQLPELAYRFSYSHFKEAIPPGSCVLHKCDNPICVNPDHLFLGTRKDNTYDMMAKGRKPIGENHYKALLKDNDVLDIRMSTESHSVMAKKYNVSNAYISAIRKGKTWKHITDLKGVLESLST